MSAILGDLLYWSCEVAVESVMTGRPIRRRPISEFDLLEWIRLA